MTNVADMVDESIHRGELLLEILSEEIPARMQRNGLEELKKRVREFLENAYLAPDTPLHGYVTPRRLTVVATGIPQQQQASDEQAIERRGPRVGAPEAAVQGFCRSVGLDPEDLERRDGYYFAKIERPGSPAKEILPKVIAEAIDATFWPKSMRFPACTLHWVRPIVSVICLFDGAIVPLALGQVPVGRVTRGHRFLCPGEISVGSATEYFERLESAKVILDWQRRKKIIDDDLTRRATEAGVTVKPDPGLLDEVTGLVEFPVVLIGAIDEASMELPPEVLTTAMRTHQKYFSCLNPDGRPAPRFLFVANNLTADHGKTIIAGNERVLRARLADARFFWEQDRKVRLEDRVEALSERVYHARLGSVRDKVRRMELISDFLVAHVPGADAERSRRAVFLAKADLSTGMVGEFPELQGIMGRYYALHEGEDPAVAVAIADHYKPQGPNDTCPTAPDSIVAALADKLDSLAAFFAINEKPTGSRDPFALRRSALGMIRLVLENGLRLPLRAAFGRAGDALGAGYPDVTGELLDFVADRLKVHLREQGVRHDLIAAVFVKPQDRVDLFVEALQGYREREDDLIRLLARVDALKKFLASEDGTNLLTAYRRASNIVTIEEKHDKRSYLDSVDGDLFRLPEEEVVFRALIEASSRATDALANEGFEEAMAALATLRQPVDTFFDKVTVNTLDEDGRLRQNRLRLLSNIRTVMNQVADFSQIEG